MIAVNAAMRLAVHSVAAGAMDPGIYNLVDDAVLAVNDATRVVYVTTYRALDPASRTTWTRWQLEP